MITVQARLEELQKRGWTLAALASALGKNRETVSRWKNDGVVESHRILVELALAHPKFRKKPPPKRRVKVAS